LHGGFELFEKEKLGAGVESEVKNTSQPGQLQMKIEDFSSLIAKGETRSGVRSLLQPP